MHAHNATCILYRHQNEGEINAEWEVAAHDL